MISIDFQCWSSVVEPVMYLLGLFGPRAHWASWPVTLNADQAPPLLTVQWRYFDRVRVSIVVWGVLVWGLLGRSWCDFAHVATGTLSLRMRNSVMIGRVRFELERGSFGSGFGFGLGIAGGAGARAAKSAYVHESSWPKYFWILLFLFWISVVRVLYYVIVLAPAKAFNSDFCHQVTNALY